MPREGRAPQYSRDARDQSRRRGVLDAPPPRGVTVMFTTIYAGSDVAIFAAHHMMIVILVTRSWEIRHGFSLRSRRHRVRRPHPARPLHGRALAVFRAQARFARDRRGAGAGETRP